VLVRFLKLDAIFHGLPHNLTFYGESSNSTVFVIQKKTVDTNKKFSLLEEFFLWNKLVDQGFRKSKVPFLVIFRFHF
jgi:hypothetical protein